MFLSLLLGALDLKAQQNEDLLKLLIRKKILTQKEADSLLTESEKNAPSTGKHDPFLNKSLQISGMVQMRYQGFQQSNLNNAFDLHRVRLDVHGNLSDEWSYDLLTEFAGPGVKLVDVEVDYKISDFLRFSAGQLKIPFSLESITSDAQLALIDRSQVVEALAARSKDVSGNNTGRDIGLVVSGSIIKMSGFYLVDYSAGIFNGAGIDVTSDNNNHKDYGGRVVLHPLKTLGIGANFYQGLAHYGTPAANEKRNRIGFDAQYVLNRWVFAAEYDKGWDGTIKRAGWYSQVAYFAIAKKLQFAVRYDTYNPDKIATADQTDWVATGVNYFITPRAKLAVDYTFRHERSDQQQKNDLFSTQLQLSF